MIPFYKSSPCYHCDPYPNDARHVAERIEHICSPFLILFRPLDWLFEHYPKFHFFLNRIIFGSLINSFLFFKIFREVEMRDDDPALYNRTLVVAREAKIRGLIMKSLAFLGMKTNQYSLEVKGKKYFFEGLPDALKDSTSSVNFGDKNILKALLKKGNLPHPKGDAFRKAKDAIAYVQKNLSYPVIVKPQSGSLSRHTTCGIQNEEELKEAIRIAQILSKEFLVEKHIEGHVYRVTMVDGKIIAACLRESPNVVGDGEHTLEELIGIKNQHQDRGELHQKNFTLHKLIVTERSRVLFKTQQTDLHLIPKMGEKIYLHDKVILAAGADVHDVTDMIHEENKALFQNVYELCHAPIIGIDFMAKDIAISHQDQTCAILEVNGLPYIDMHHYPVTGKPRNVAGAILDYYLSLHQKNRKDFYVDE